LVAPQFKILGIRGCHMFILKAASLNMPAMLDQMLKGYGSSIILFAFTLLFSLPLGLLVAFMRMSSFKPLSWLTRFFISIMRGTPLMLQLMVVFFGPFFLLGIKVGTEYRIYAAVIGFSINYAAYFAEIYRGGILSIPKGQYEASEVLGFSRVQTFIRIILPQVIKNVIPAVTNEIITLVKDTSLAMVISYVEMFAIARSLVSTTSSLIPFVVAGVFYYFTNLLVAFIMEHFEKKLNYYE